MSPSSCDSAFAYGAFPTANSWYCSHRSLSMISAAARNLRMATSPALSPLAACVCPCASAVETMPRPVPRATPAMPSVRRADLLPIGPFSTVSGGEVLAAVDLVRLFIWVSLLERWVLAIRSEVWSRACHHRCGQWGGSPFPFPDHFIEPG